jgi:hypothetical protein
MSLVIDHLATSAVTRRGTLALGSAAALLGLTQLGSANARKNKKNRKNRKQKKSCESTAQQRVEETCGPQADECAAFFSASCGQFDDPQKCAEIITSCCAALAECRFREAILCVTTTPLE